MLRRYMNIRIEGMEYKKLNDNLCYIDYVDREYVYDVKVLEPVEAYRMQGNLYGVFSMLGVSPDLFTYAMYLNGYTNPSNYDGEKISFKIPVRPPIPTS